MWDDHNNEESPATQKNSFPRGAAADAALLGIDTNAFLAEAPRSIWTGIISDDGVLHRRDRTGLLRASTAWVYNCVNGPDHAGFCERLLQYGHVVVSAFPGWLSLEQIKDLDRRSSTHGGMLRGISLYRCQPIMQQLQALLAGGMLGPLFNLRGTYVQYLPPYVDTDIPWQPSAAAAAETAALYQWLIQQPIHKVLCHPKAPETVQPRQTHSETEAGFERSISVMLQFASGTIGSFSLLQSTAQSPQHGHLVLGFDGSLGSLDWDQGEQSSLRLQWHAAEGSFRMELQEPRQPDAWTWLDLLRQTTVTAWLSTVEIRVVAELATAVQRSLQEGKWIDVARQV